MVRLKQLAGKPETVRQKKFQFLYGAIKTFSH